MNKIIKILKKFYMDTRFFSFRLAILHLKETLARYTFYKMPAASYLEKDKIILDYLKVHYPIDLSYEVGLNGKHVSKIWVFWYQGENQMPNLVKYTYDSIKRNANGHLVELITKDNVDNFIKIPQTIKKRVAMKKISVAQYSDIIRAALLAEYGGLWIDSTVLVTRPIPDEIFSREFFTIKNEEDRKNPLFYISVAHLRWTTYVMGGTAGNALFIYMKNGLIKYNSEEHALIDYLLIDYFIEVAYETLPDVKIMFQKLPVTNIEKESLVHRLNVTFPDSETERLLVGDTYFFKLTYKMRKMSSKVPTNYDLLNHQKFLKSYSRGENN
ncbi:hypothetical protein A6F53_09880 [Levilactobacillus brevis]|uniref:capsular polysaccharide synthesis protein n=1 Tax=Levilactobacillus brevis TaxID=1580 RepID=UPI0007F919B3|nr:capsular polysaccharide synthesis protein [Levilactobacillus brevis]ANN49534.1 hypothetical protein A6F53_09880 [Levilactobacillus brevis]